MTKRIGYFLAVMTLLATTASATPITFSTTAVFSGGLSPNTNVFIVINGAGTTLSFNGTANSVNPDAGAQFGDILAVSTIPPDILGPAITGNLTLTFTQSSPAGAGSLLGTLGFNNGVATLAFGAGQQSVVLPGGFVYTVNPVYTIALPSTGTGGTAGLGTTSLQGTVTGPSVPDSGSTLMLLGSAFLAVTALRRKLTH